MADKAAEQQTSAILHDEVDNLREHLDEANAHRTESGAISYWKNEAAEYDIVIK